ncbi:hypothetical protein KO317_02630 [Candidatus Micrarchaeota archaeon]|nr:hypothetical protein [Candidatus Micrarchaeota archaeon]
MKNYQKQLKIEKIVTSKGKILKYFFDGISVESEFNILFLKRQILHILEPDKYLKPIKFKIGIFGKCITIFERNFDHQIWCPDYCLPTTNNLNQKIEKIQNPYTQDDLFRLIDEIYKLQKQLTFEIPNSFGDPLTSKN